MGQVFAWSCLILALTSCVSGGALAQKKCCECRGDARNFQIPQDSGCEIGCSASGGKFTGQIPACYGTATPTKPGARDCRDRMEVIGGDCQGNNWCACFTGLHAVGGHPPFGITQLNYRDHPLTVGEEVQFVLGGSPEFGMENHGGRTRLGDLHCTLRFGDGDFIECKIGQFPTPRHAYAKPGEYEVTYEVVGDFKWHSDSGSCSYRCRSDVLKLPLKVVAATTK
jgi:hypothetical protein